MKKDSPISLFSFQDIITCLTGIMIVIVLIILLQLVEATVGQHSNTADNKRLQELREQEKQLLVYQEELAKEIPQEVDMNDVTYSEYTAEELEMLIRQAAEKQRELAAQIAMLKAGIEKIDNLEPLKNLEAELRRELAELQKDQHRLLELRAQAAALKKQQQETREAIETKRKSVRFELSGSRNVQPVIIECNTWGFRVQKYPDGEVVTFGSKSTKLPENISAMVAYVQKFDRTKYYPLLFFRDKTLKYDEAIQIAFYKKFGYNLKIGKELLGADEECFYHE